MEMPANIAKKIEDFFSKYPLKKYEKGQLLLLADENPQNIVYLVSGHVREYDISYRGDEIVVNVFKPPSFFPMSWATNKIPNRYFFEAGSDVTCREAPPEDALEFIEKNPDVTLDLLKRIYSGVDGMRRRMAHLMAGSAKSRLLFELIIEAKRFGKELGKGAYLININETELGARAGLSRETVSRELHQLKNQKLIGVSRRGITLKNIESIESELGSNL
jgi:CRP-like cAMP-binding protein